MDRFAITQTTTQYGEHDYHLAFIWVAGLQPKLIVHQERHNTNSSNSYNEASAFLTSCDDLRQLVCTISVLVVKIMFTCLRNSMAYTVVAFLVY
jgi:hypothetical protein